MYSSLLLPLLAASGVAAQSWPVQSYVTEDFHPPVLAVNKSGPTADGYLFFAVDASNATSTPLIMSDSGDLIWQSDGYVPPGGQQIFMNFDLQQLGGQSYLSYFNGTASGSHAYGSVEILDHSYQQAYHICLRPGNVVLSNTSLHPTCFSDLHESQFTNRGTILLSLYNVTQANLTPVGGPANGYILDCQFYEVDIKTNNVLFSWKSLDHQAQLPINMSHYPIGKTGTAQTTPYDYFHINSVTATPDGGYLVSSRHLWAAIKLNSTGAIEWVLPGNGVSSDFATIDPAVRFSWQHHVRVANATSTGMTISMHNNANSEVTPRTSPTSGLLISLNLANPQHRTATLLRNLTDPRNEIYSFAEGSYQTLPNGNVLLEHGFVPIFQEYLPSGAVAMTARFGPDGTMANAYRGWRYPFVGLPKTAPKAAAANNSSGAPQLYMSWNGATGYDQWMVYEGTTQGNLRFVTNVTRHGFETSVPLKAGTHGFAQVKAVQKGVVQGQSAIVSY